MPRHAPLNSLPYVGTLLLSCMLFLSLMTAANAAQAARKSQKSPKPRSAAEKQHKPMRAKHRAASSRRGKAAVAATAAVGAGTAAVTAKAEGSASATPELLPRCGFTNASRRQMFSRAAYVLDEQTGTTLYERNADSPVPIASLSKLMTAVVWLEHEHAPMNSMLEVTDDDLDTLKQTQSRLSVGSRLSRADMLHIALMSSENRAAAALSRDYPGGRPAFIEAMNAKARQLQMPNTHFVNATGLSPENVSTARELATLVRTANTFPLIRTYSIDKQDTVNIGRGQLHYINSNRLVRYNQVQASVQKTGFINEAGHNMVFRMMVHANRPVIVTLLGSGSGDGVRLDGMRVAKWLSCSLR